MSFAGSFRRISIFWPLPGFLLYKSTQSHPKHRNWGSIWLEPLKPTNQTPSPQEVKHWMSRGRMIWGFTASPPPTAGCVRRIRTSQSKKSILEHAGCRSSGWTDTGHWRYGWSGPIEMGGDWLVDIAMHRSRVIRVKIIPSYCWWKESGEHQLRLVVFIPLFAGFLAPSQVVRDFSHQQYGLRIFQRSPGTYPRLQTNSLWFGILFISGWQRMPGDMGNGWVTL